MRMLIVTADSPRAEYPHHAIVCHDVRNPHQRSEVVVRKGTPLASADIASLLARGGRRAGGQVVQIGIPAEPGTACWIGRLESTPVLGLASCELFGQPGALDLLLPRLLTGEALDVGLLRRIALGGLLLGPGRIAPYHVPIGTVD
jgi:hypothetical protein